MRRAPGALVSSALIPTARWSHSAWPNVAVHSDVPTHSCLAGLSSAVPSGTGRSLFGTPPRGAPSDYEMSLGKIRCVLQEDYSSFFKREPSFEIYHDRIVFELGRPFQPLSAVTGKPAYRRALVTLQGLGKRALSDGVMKCRVSDGRPFGHDLQVSWSCEGYFLRFGQLVHVSAISSYKIAKQDTEEPGDVRLSHRIQRHCIEFTHIHPPSIRNLLQKFCWQPHMDLDPALAYLTPEEFCDVSAAEWDG